MNRLTEAIKHLLIINVLFFVATQVPAIGDRMYLWFSLWFPKSENFELWQIITHMFMHGGFMHIAFNMYALWAFGTPLERMWGKNKFLFFYISAGLGSALLHTAINYFHFQEGFDALVSSGIQEGRLMEIISQGGYVEAWSTILGDGGLQDFASSYSVPAVGASGAIYGILVAYAFSYPNSELMLIFLPVPVKAKYFVPVLLLLDLFSGVTGYGIFGQGIAHFAHIGGAITGFLMMWYWKKNSFNDKRWN